MLFTLKKKKKKQAVLVDYSISASCHQTNVDFFFLPLSDRTTFSVAFITFKMVLIPVANYVLCDQCLILKIVFKSSRREIKAAQIINFCMSRCLYCHTPAFTLPALIEMRWTNKGHAALSVTWSVEFPPIVFETVDSWGGGNLDAGGRSSSSATSSRGTVRSSTGIHHHGFSTESHTAHTHEFNLFLVTVRLRALPRRCRGRARQAHLYGGDVQQCSAHCAPLCHVLRPVVSGRVNVHDKVLLFFSFSILDIAAFSLQRSY